MASASPLEPYNVWQDVPSSVTSRSNNIILSNIDDDDSDSTLTTTTTMSSSSASRGSPTRYSVQTIRQKKGRQLVSTMMGGSDDGDRSGSNGSTVGVIGGGLFPTAGTSSTVAFEETSEGDGESGGKKKTTITSTRTTTASSSPSEPSTPTAGDAGSQTSGAGTGPAGGHVGLGKTSLPHGGRRGFPSVGLYQGIGRVQAFSAMAFSTFAVIHLVPPMLASVGGVELANKALLWGRVYYQTYGLEQVLVSGSLLVHLGAGFCKAVIRLVWKVKSYYYRDSSSVATLGAIEEGGVGTIKESSTSTNGSGSTTTTIMTTTTKTTKSSTGGSGSASAPGLFPYHRLAGWILTPLVIAHMNVMRLAPLDVLGDSSMVDYSFVTYLHRIGRSGPYALLVGLLTYHMASGGPIAFNMVLPRWRWSLRELIGSRKWRGVVAGVIVVIALVGTGRIMYAKGAIPMSRVYLSLLDL